MEASSLSDPEVWKTDRRSSQVNDMAYDATSGVLYEVGFRATDYYTGDRLSSREFFVRGIDIVSGNFTLFIQNGSTNTDSLNGGHFRGPVRS